MGERNGRQVGFSAALALRPATGIFRHSFGSSAGFNPHPKGFFVKGFVPTPASMVDVMVAKLFAERAPSSDTSVLDPGCGDGEFIEGILRACAANGWAVPRIVGVELDPNRAAAAKRRFTPYPHVEIRHADFLHPADERFDFIVGNPPYVAITSLSLDERTSYRAAYNTAVGRFDLYLLFFEQALRLLKADGRLVFITPEKFLYVETARPLRELILQHELAELHFASEATFSDRVTYPVVTTINARRVDRGTRIVRRDGIESNVRFSSSGSWQAAINGFARRSDAPLRRLADVALRISCGVATGADGVFVVPSSAVTPGLKPFAHPTVSGRQILPSHEVILRSTLLAPYDAHGALLVESALGELGQFLREPERRRQLQGRTCTDRKPWYAFHDNFPLADMLRPKLLCKDITEEPFFVIDHDGRLVPRHSVYYVVPADPADLEPLAEYLNSPAAREWLRAHCQRAANGFLRMQSHVLKELPVPAGFRARVETAKSASVQPELVFA